MEQFIAFGIIGIVTGSVYAVGATGLVLTYATSGVFNIAHGAIGMLMAFTFWELHEEQGWPTWIALPLILFVIAPLFGAAIERTLMRGLRGASVATSLVVTVGLMVGLIGLANAIWPPTEGRKSFGFFAPSGVDVGPVFVTWHDIITILTGAGVAVFLWLFLSRARIGIAMRAVVDDRNLISLNGARPGQISMLSWAMGASLAAAAGILIAPVLSLNVLTLTLLIINAYAAAMAGRLKSLPLTFIGALALGLIQAYVVGYVNLTGWLLGLRPALPTLFLFIILLVLPQDRLRSGRLAGAKTPPVPSLRRSIQGAAALVGVAILATFVLGSADLARVGLGLAFGIIMLSLVPLTGYGGQVSLCQMSFAGLGAFAMAHLGGSGSPFGLIAAVLIAGAAGALVALPALRLQGLYLALATMAFAVFLDEMVFSQAGVFGNFGSLSVGRLDILGLSFDSEEMYLILLAIAFGGMGVFVLWLRRGPFGRLLAAMRDSQVASATLGLSLTRTKLAVFTLSAALAGLGGALLAGLQTQAGSLDFLMLFSLPVLLLAVIGGINTVGGALLGGMIYSVLQILPEKAAAAGGLVEQLANGMIYMLIGGAAVSLGRNPNGLSAMISSLKGEVVRRVRPTPVEPEPIPVPVEEEAASLVAPTG